MYNEWNKIDLHIHTQHGITFDGRTKEGTAPNYFTPFNFCKRNVINHLKLTSITNHNMIDVIELIKTSYCSLKFSGCQVLPGVELDVELRDQKFYHIILTFSSRVNVLEISYRIKNFIYNKDRRYVTFDELIRIITNTECIVIPHACKSKGLKENANTDISTVVANDFIEMISTGNYINVLFEHTKPYYADNFARNMIENSSLNWLSEDEYEERINQLEAKIKIRYTASDYRFSTPEPIKEGSFVAIWSSPSYRGLELACIFCSNRMKNENEIIDRSNFIGKIKIMGNKHFDESEIELSSGLNSIVGNSASGKTALLHIIAKKLGDKKINDNDYAFTDDLNVEFYDKDNKPLNKCDIDIEVSSQIYTEIKTIQESDNIEVLKLFGYSVKSKSLVLDNYQKNIESYCSNYSAYNVINNNMVYSIKQFNDNVINFILNYPRGVKINISIQPISFEIVNHKLEKIEQLNLKVRESSNLLDKLYKIYDDIKFELKEQKIKNTIYEQIHALRKEVSKVESQIDFIRNELKYRKILNVRLKTFVDEFNIRIGQKSEYLERVKMMIESSKQMIMEELNAALYNFYKCENSDLTFPSKALLLEINKNNKNEYIELDVNLDENMLKLSKDYGFIDIKKINTLLSGFLGKDNITLDTSQNVKNVINVIIKNNKDVNLKTNDLLDQIIKNSNIKLGYPNKEKQNIWEISPGDTSKIYLDYKFKNSFKNGIVNVVLFDQPENDVDKEFIYSNLLKKIDDLKKEVQVIVTSHDPIIVINGDSNVIIKAEKNKMDGVLKIKYISNFLENYRGDIPVTSLISKYVDGSEEAVKLRTNIYEGGWKK